MVTRTPLDPNILYGNKDDTEIDVTGADIKGKGSNKIFFGLTFFPPNPILSTLLNSPRRTDYHNVFTKSEGALELKKKWLETGLNSGK